MWCGRNSVFCKVQTLRWLHDHPVLRTSVFGISLKTHLTSFQSPDCQKHHWSSHKAICQHTSSQVSAAKQQAVHPGYVDENLVKYLRKFTSAHQELLNWVVFQALQLKRVPANVRQQALLIELEYNQSGSDPLQRYESFSKRSCVRAHLSHLGLRSKEHISFRAHTSLARIDSSQMIFSVGTIVVAVPVALEQLSF
jgi:hypothetical protein